MFDVSSHLLYPLSTLLSTDQLIAFAILDWSSIHTSLDRSGTILYHHYSWPPSIRGLYVDWWNEHRWHTRISATCYRHEQTSTSTKQPSIRVPNLCSINLILILWQVIHCHHPLHCPMAISDQVHTLIGYTMRYRILWEVIINKSRYGIPKMSSIMVWWGIIEFRGGKFGLLLHIMVSWHVFCLCELVNLFLVRR